ncbi:MAG: hypothetical protein KAV82_01980 [Phycisphaerae bacterium]|nr:hypothetical protein [Phycisphaerae bacterium]
MFGGFVMIVPAGINIGLFLGGVLPASAGTWGVVEDINRCMDLDDYPAFHACITGPEGGPYPPGCEVFDSDSDGDVDLIDFAVFQDAFGMPTGACCFPGGTCKVSTAEACAEAGGGYGGNGSSCDPNPCPRPGNTCDMPLVVRLPEDMGSNLVYVDLNTTCGRRNDYDDTCLDYYDGGEDVIYELIVSSALLVLIELDPMSSEWTGMAIDDTCPLSDPCMGSSTNDASFPHFIDVVLLSEGTYYLMIDTWPPPDCIPQYELTISLVLP